MKLEHLDRVVQLRNEFVRLDQIEQAHLRDAVTLLKVVHDHSDLTLTSEELDAILTIALGAIDRRRNTILGQMAQYGVTTP